MSARIAVICVLAQSLIYGFGDPISKFAFAILPVYPALAGRYIIASLALLIFAGKPLYHKFRQYPVKPLLLPSIAIGLAYLVGNLAISLTAATTVAFLRSLAIVFTPILAFIASRTPYSWKHLPVLGMMLIGLYCLCGVAENGISSFGLGEVFSLLSGFMIAASLVFGQSAIAKADPLALTATQTFATTIITLIAAAFVPGGYDFSPATPMVWAIVAYLGLACTIGGYLLQNAALEGISSSTVALIQCICPVLTALFSFLILGETLTTIGLIGATLILLCLIAETLLQQK